MYDITASAPGYKIKIIKIVHNLKKKWHYWKRQLFLLVMRGLHRLSIFERKILRRIYGPVMDGGRWRIRTNQELYQQCGKNDITKFCKLSRLRWAGHVKRQDDDDLSRRVLLSEPGGKRHSGRPRLRWFILWNSHQGKKSIHPATMANWALFYLNFDVTRCLLNSQNTRNLRPKTIINFRAPGGFSQLSWKQNFDNYRQSCSGLERSKFVILSYRFVIPLILYDMIWYDMIWYIC